MYPYADTRDGVLLGGKPDMGQQLALPSEFRRFNHNIFRFPAKFHPPVARALIELYSNPGDVILDPFCGSGTTLVEASLLGRSSVGTDVDPLSVFVSGAKTASYNIEILRFEAGALKHIISDRREADIKCWGDLQLDISETIFEGNKSVMSPYVPEIPNIIHWFRRRVILQLAVIKRDIENTISAASRNFFLLCFASIIRNSSNADPVPVSGLEVTKHMKMKEIKGRTIDPYKLFMNAIDKNFIATSEFCMEKNESILARVVQADARFLSVKGTGLIDCIITSPPYLTAVDYYRRHSLEMYWLSLIGNPTERLALLPCYLGRDRVGIRYVTNENGHREAEAIAAHWLQKLPVVKSEKARSFIHYCIGIAQSLESMAGVARDQAKVIVVVGDVRFAGCKISMAKLIQDLCPPSLTKHNQHWYPIINRYMSYTRNNGADISIDNVVVLEKR